MKRTMTNALAIAAAASWVMVASAQSTTGTQSRPGEQQEWSESKSMKFTGCLKEGDTPNSFKLTDVQPADPSRSGSTSGTSGSGTTGSGTSGSGMSGMGSSSMMGNELELVATGATVNLREHVGKRVEITGKAAKSDKDRDTTSGTSGSGTTGSGTTGSGTGMSGSGSQSGAHSGHDMGKKKLQVTNVRELGGSCQ